LELEVEVLRGYAHSHLPTDEYYLPNIFLKLGLHFGRELDAFRDIFDEYRGIIRKLCEWGGLHFSTNSVIGQVEAVHSQKPVPKLEAFLHIKDLDPDHQWFDLEFIWFPSTSLEEGLRAFTAQAILFTCIEKAAVSQRARRDYILDFWRELEATPLGQRRT
jgi:hypothetical protein